MVGLAPSVPKRVATPTQRSSSIPNSVSKYLNASLSLPAIIHLGYDTVRSLGTVAPS